LRQLERCIQAELATLVVLSIFGAPLDSCSAYCAVLWNVIGCLRSLLNTPCAIVDSAARRAVESQIMQKAVFELALAYCWQYREKLSRRWPFYISHHTWYYRLCKMAFGETGDPALAIPPQPPARLWSSKAQTRAVKENYQSRPRSRE